MSWSWDLGNAICVFQQMVELKLMYRREEVLDSRAVWRECGKAQVTESEFCIKTHASANKHRYYSDNWLLGCLNFLLIGKKKMVCVLRAGKPTLRVSDLNNTCHIFFKIKYPGCGPATHTSASCTHTHAQSEEIQGDFCNLNTVNISSEDEHLW